MKKKIAITLVLILIVIQFIPVDKTNPESDPANDFITITQPDEEIAELIKVACYDCHSNNTVYPWYSNIAPISFWMQGHITEGRRQLNFSNWGSYTDEGKADLFSRASKAIEDKWMPLGSYMLGHPEAKLTDEQRKLLIDFFTGVE